MRSKATLEAWRVRIDTFLDPIEGFDLFLAPGSDNLAGLINLIMEIAGADPIDWRLP